MLSGEPLSMTAVEVTLMHMPGTSSPVHLPRTLAFVIGAVVVAAACGGDGSARPHVDHVSLPTHRAWKIVSVQPYEGLEEVELVKFDWPTATAPSVAFALTREALKVGDAVCLDHVQEIDTFWAHPVPTGGCEVLGTPAASRQP